MKSSVKLRVKALEKLFSRPLREDADLPAEFTPEDLWRAYERLGEEVGNRENLLFGDAEAWFERAADLRAGNKYDARAVYALLAMRADVHGVLFCTRPPWWLQQGHAGWTPAKQVTEAPTVHAWCRAFHPAFSPFVQLLITARLYSSLLRWRYCMAGHTGYSHLQLTSASDRTPDATDVVDPGG